MARRPSETLFQTACDLLQNALSVAPAQAGARPEAQLQLFEHVGFRQNAQTTEADSSGRLCAALKKHFTKDRPVCFMKIVDFMRTITPFHGVHTYADTNRRRYD